MDVEAGQRTKVELGTVDLDTRCVVGTDVKLSPTEARLLARLVSARGEPVDRDRLLVDVWGHRPGSESRTLFATIERLRKKIERDPRRPRHLLTVGGAGYAFRPLEDEPVVAVAVPPAAAPPADDAFVGRARELQAIGDWLRLANPGPLTLRGPGGVGKTRLAREALARAPEGTTTCFVDLSWCATFADVVEALGRAMDLPLGRQEPQRHLIRVARVLCRQGPCLVVLDNAESAPAVVADVLRHWPTEGPHHLVTSRVALGLSDERVLVVDPLPLPDGDGRSDATDLFDARSASRGGSDGDRAAVAELVRFLEGTPLAIELAA
ncbi:MAG: winged helix-turn-helix domain-containing protein, partial [Myxococcales bacterium]|nr:winged helix-turn-helix domain-containing protein [Myxococcales bacterium]